MLAALPAAQVRALFPDRSAFVLRQAGRGPASLTTLRRLLAEVTRRGFALEDGDITPGLESVAIAVHDHTGRPVAALAVTFASVVDAPDVAARAQPLLEALADGRGHARAAPRCHPVAEGLSGRGPAG